MSDLGSAVSKEFGASFKQMGFEEKTLQKFLETRAAGKVKSDGNTVTLL